MLDIRCIDVDIIFLIENVVPMMTQIKVWLSKKFFMKDMGEASCILKIKIYRDRSKRMLGLHRNYAQRKY